MRIEKRRPIMNRIVMKHPVLDSRRSHDEQTKARDHGDGAAWILHDPGVEALVTEQRNRRDQKADARGGIESAGARKRNPEHRHVQEQRPPEQQRAPTSVTDRQCNADNSEQEDEETKTAMNRRIEIEVVPARSPGVVEGPRCFRRGDR